MVREWVKQGNDYYLARSPISVYHYYYGPDRPDLPDHPELSAGDAHQFCIRDRGKSSWDFPSGILRSSASVVGDGKDQWGKSQLLPGLYEYRDMVTGVNRAPNSCRLSTDQGEKVELPQDEPFTFRLFEYHGRVTLGCYPGTLYRIGD